LWIVPHGSGASAASDLEVSTGARQLNGAQVAVVTTYVRNTSGHAASAVSPDDVKEARDALKQPPQ
jgi:mono/diheme cytochrome c family protein